MMTTIKTFLLLAAALLALTACDTQQSITAPSSLKEVSGNSQNQPAYKGPGPSEDTFNPVWHDRNLEAGYIFLANDAKNLYVTYYTDDKWLMSEANLHVARSIEEIPRDAQGVPLSEEFAYQSPANRCTQIFSYTIPLAQLGLAPGDAIVIASQATVAPITSRESGGKLDFGCGDSNSSVDWWYLGNSRIRTILNGTDSTARVEIGMIPIQPRKA